MRVGSARLRRILSRAIFWLGALSSRINAWLVSANDYIRDVCGKIYNRILVRIELGPVTMRARYHQLPDEGKPIFWGLGVYLVLLAAAVCIEQIWTTDELEPLYFWIQMAIGSSWPSPLDGYNERWPFGFAMAVTTHVFLTFVPVLAFFWILLKLVRLERSAAMNFQQLIASRDLPIEERVLQVVEDTLTERGVEFTDGERQEIERRIGLAFEEGERVWATEELPALLTAPRAAIVRKRLEENVV